MAQMADVSGKPTTLRTAVAEGFIRVPRPVLARIADGNIPKGDPLTIGRIAGILGAKKTAELLPLCHPLPVEWVNVDARPETGGIRVTAQVKAVARTGMEMEALTAVACALLSIYDVLKPLTQDLRIEEIKLVEKKGGKSSWKVKPSREMTCGILVISDSVYAGKKEDRSGQILKETAEREGIRVVDFKVVPDEVPEIRKAVEKWIHEGLDLVMTTGGTGISPRDVTVEAIRPLIEREIPGISEAVRGYGQARTPFAMLSRGIAGISGKTLIATLPGSPEGVRDGLTVLLPALNHCLHIAGGGTHEQAKRAKRRSA
jgi:cyclic pyranopterin phosphate synthase